MNGFAGRRIVVTGAGTGLGRAIAGEFAREGAAVAFHYAYDCEHARDDVDKIVSSGGVAGAFCADFRRHDSAATLAREMLAFLGGVDVLVNNAGITANIPFEEVTGDQFDTLFHVNVRAGFFLTQALARELRNSRGAVVNITSIHAIGGVREHSVYAATRGAGAALTRQLAIELAPEVRVNAIAPGAIEVENYYRALPSFEPAQFGRNIPVGFTGQSIDIARVALFLASDDARYITGQTLVVDGGVTSWFAFNEDFRKPVDAVWGKGYLPGR